MYNFTLSLVYRDSIGIFAITLSGPAVNKLKFDVNVCTYVCMYVCMYVCVCMYECTYVSMYECICVCIMSMFCRMISLAYKALYPLFYHSVPPCRDYKYK